VVRVWPRELHVAVGLRASYVVVQAIVVVVSAGLRVQGAALVALVALVTRGVVK
jgi:hypothetical protein